MAVALENGKAALDPIATRAELRRGPGYWVDLVPSPWSSFLEELDDLCEGLSQSIEAQGQETL